MMDVLEKRHAILVTEFDRYVIEHPEFAAEIPPNAQVVLQMEGDDEYNEWSRQLAERQREEGQPAIYVKVKGLKPAKSRLIKPEVAVSLSSPSLSLRFLKNTSLFILNQPLQAILHIPIS